MSIRTSLSLDYLKRLQSNIYDSIHCLEEWGYASCPKENDERYKEMDKRLRTLLEEADKIFDELCEESKENFEY